jgi:hypothetical protein
MNMPTDQAIKTKNNYLCARCWHTLVAVAVPGAPGQSDVKCANENCNGEGFAKKSAVEHRRSEELSELWEARDNLKAVIPSEHAGKSEEQLLSELGF